MTQDASWTVGRLLSWTTDYLRRHGSDTARLDAEILLAEALGCERIELYTRYEEAAGEQARTAFRELVRRRAEGTPVAYLVGHREFYSLRFRVTPDVLIPRPETELLVVALLDLARQAPGGSPPTICDVGTGCGIIAVCAAKHLPESRVTALDISPEALEVARANAAEHGVADRIEFLQSDLFAQVPPDRTFDFVVSNPPYVTEAELETLAPEVRQFEPRQALVAGRRGTEVIKQLLEQAGPRLNPGGYLLVEISPMIHQPICQRARADGRFHLEKSIKDLGRQPRVIQLRRR